MSCYILLLIYFVDGISKYNLNSQVKSFYLKLITYLWKNEKLTIVYVAYDLIASD